jgi:hypothetical protein
MTTNAAGASPVECRVRPRAWLREPKVQRHIGRHLVRGVSVTEPTAEEREFADLDGDVLVPLYAMPTDWALFEVVNIDGLTEASTEGPRDTAFAEAMHYAAQYGQDGAVTVFEVLRVPLLVLPGPNVEPTCAGTASS